MFVRKWGDIDIDASRGPSADIEQVLFHMGSAVNDAQTDEIVGYLDEGKIFSAAKALAAIAAAKRRSLSSEDRDLLRRIIEEHRGDPTNLGILDSLSVTGASATASKTPPLA